MKNRYQRIFQKILVGIVLVSGVFLQNIPMAMAKTGLTVMPMNQKIIVNPGESQEISFRISNPSSSTENMYYRLSVEPFYLTNGESSAKVEELVFEAEEGMSEIINWVEFNVPVKGELKPNEVKEVILTIDVPKSAPAGGQYFAVIITDRSDEESQTGDDDSQAKNKTMIKDIRRMAHLVYAEVTGSAIKQGEIVDVNIPSFLLSGNVAGTSIVKNTGNVHSSATYTMQVFPLFSGEEVYTNEEEPESRTVLPNRTVYHETAWDKTPGIGIFNVVYTVKFGDATKQISKMVVKCPVWLLFLILFVIAAIIFYFVTRVKARRNSRRDEE